MKAIIEINKFGTIKVELNKEVAPITVENFVKLVNKGFYNGLTFHRVIKGFMIQRIADYQNKHDPENRIDRSLSNE